MKKKLFGQNIIPSCSYCENYVVENVIAYCKKGKLMKDDKCRKFIYDPLMRVPLSTSTIEGFTHDDFKL